MERQVAAKALPGVTGRTAPWHLGKMMRNFGYTMHDCPYLDPAEIVMFEKGFNLEPCPPIDFPSRNSLDNHA